MPTRLRRALIITLAISIAFVGLTGCESSDDNDVPSPPEPAPAPEIVAQPEQPDEPVAEPAPAEEPEFSMPSDDREERDDEPLFAPRQQDQITNRDLDRLAEAVNAMGRLQPRLERIQRRLRQAESSQDIRQIQGEMKNLLESTVERTGMSVDEYERLSKRVEDDPELERRLGERVRITEVETPEQEAQRIEEMGGDRVWED